jgi:hypothetical protein
MEKWKNIAKRALVAAKFIVTHVIYAALKSLRSLWRRSTLNRSADKVGDKRSGGIVRILLSAQKIEITGKNGCI